MGIGMSGITETIGRAVVKVFADGSGIPDQIRAELASADPEVRKAGKRHADDYAEEFGKKIEKDKKIVESIKKKVDEALPKGKDNDRIRRFSESIDQATDKFGRMFGKGSRNNAVNFFGSIIAGAINLLDLIPKTILKFKEMGTAMKVAFAEGGGGISGFLKATGPLMANIGILLGGLLLMIAIAGPVVSLMFGLAGGILAVASALAFASAGALGAIGALMLPLAGAVGVLALAFTGLDKSMKKSLKESFAPMKKELGVLQKIAQKGVFGGVKRSADDFAEAFKGLRPLVRGISRALGDVIEGFGEAVNSRGMRAFIETMGEALPGMIKSLGRIFTNTVGGFGGLFAAAIPIAQRFLGWLESLTQRFTDFTNSRKGKNELVGFFDKAAESAGKVWGLIKQVGGILKKLFLNEDGRKAGGGILDDMKNGLQDINDWLDEHPDALKDFFKNGKETMRDVGHLIKQIGKFLDKLDTPQHRQIAHMIFGAIGHAIGLMGTAINVLKFSALTELIGVLGDVGEAGTGMNTVMREALAGLVSGFLGAVGKIVHGAAVAFGWIPGIGKKLKKADQDFQIFARQADAAIRGITDHVDVRVQTAGGPSAIAELARVRYATDKIPREVTTRVMIKSENVPRTASGGIFSGGQHRIIGEAGPEAVVPLNRPLSQVDPAVRALSAVAQGLSGLSGQDGGRGVNVGGITIITPTEDPRAVARETINRLAAAAY